jgi:predicted dehydrogenase
MIAACERAGVNLMTAYPVRFHPAFAALRHSLTDGSLGRLLSVHGVNNSSPPALERSWFADPALSGGGAVMDHTVHAADAIRWILGEEVARVHAEIGSFLYGLEVEDCGLLTLDLSSGAFASIDSSWSRPRTFPTWGGVTLHVVADNATVDVDVFRQALTHYDDTTGRTRLVGWGDDLTARMIAGFVDAILARRPVPIDGDAGLRALEVALAAYRSAAERRPIVIAELRA